MYPVTSTSSRDLRTLHYSGVISSEPDPFLCDLDVDSWRKVNTPQELEQWPCRCGHSSKDGYSIRCHFPCLNEEMYRLMYLKVVCNEIVL